MKELPVCLFIRSGKTAPKRPILDLDATSTATFKANQLRLWFASLAYVLVTALRRLALEGTELENATAGPSG